MGEEFIWSKLRDKAYKLSRQSGVTQGAGADGAHKEINIGTKIYLCR
jgi:hypothetical protein